jgi:hypothetical protein
MSGTHGGSLGRGGIVLLVLAAALLGPGAARADGKFYARDRVPARGPYQRALLIHHEGRELLVLQPKIAGGASDFGWIVPVPAEPRVGSVPNELDENLFENLGYLTRADVEDRSGSGRGVIAALVLLAIVIWGWRRPADRLGALLVLLVIVILMGFTVPVLTRGRGGGTGVDVLLAARVGIYDVAVIRSSDPGALRAWFEKHGFRSGPEDEAVLASYASRGWCFVTARIAGSLDQRSAREGLVPALVLTFSAPEPIYPFALTATYGEETEVLLYVVARGKVTHPALELAYAAPLDDWMPDAMKDGFLDWIDWADTPDVDVWPDHPPATGFLTKLRGRLSKRNAPGDLHFTPAADDRPYRETRRLWW